MSQTIGQLLVELGVNTASFKDGLDKATYMAKQFAEQAKESFSALKGSVMELAQEFNLLPPQVSSALSKISEVIEPLTGFLETPQGAVAALGASFLAAGVLADGLAIHFSETAARAKDLSEVTGLTVKQISGLGDVAETKGVSMDSMARALSRMDKSALAAAQSSVHASNAYTDLGIAVKNADGSLKGADQILGSVADKFKTMADGPQKTADAIKIFGRTGMELIPILNMGSDGIEELVGKFSKLNAVVDEGTAKASVTLKTNMTLMGAVFTGFENQLTKDLVPALNVVAEEFVNFFVDHADDVKAFADGMAYAGKVVLNALQIIGTAMVAVSQIVIGNFKALWDLVGPIVRMIGDAFVDLYNNRIKPAIDVLVVAFDYWIPKLGALGAAIGKIVGGSGGLGAVLVKAASDMKKGWTDAFATVEGGLKNMHAVWDAKLPGADKEGGKDKGDASKKEDFSFVDKEVRALEGKAAAAQQAAEASGIGTEASIDAKAASELVTAQYKLESEELAKKGTLTDAFRMKMEQVAPAMQKAAQWSATFNAVTEDQKALDSFNQKLKDQINTLEEQNAAGTDIEKVWAKNNAALVPLTDKVSQLGLKIQELSVAYGANSNEVKAAQADLVRLNAELDTARERTAKLNEVTQASKIEAKFKSIATATQEMVDENNAVVAGNPYGKMEAQLESFIVQTNVGTAAANKLRDALKGQEQEMAKQQALAAAKGAGFDPVKMTELANTVKELGLMWEKGTLSATQYDQAVKQIEKEQADLAAKSGGFFEGLRAGFADFQANTESSGLTMEKVIDEGLKGITDNFASMVATGKASWQSLIDSMEQALLKAAFQKILSSLFSSLSSGLGGLSGSGNGFLSGIGDMFKASGGDVTPGQSYIVGEKGPELFTPGAAGVITPNHALTSMGGGQTIVQNWNIQTPNADSFQRSQSQLGSAMWREAAAAHSRMRQ